MENSYEVRFCRPDGGLSLLMQAHFASDHDAIESTRQLLCARMPKASIVRLESSALVLPADN